MIERSLGLETLFVIIDIPPEQGQMNSVHIVDLMFFNNVLIWKIWVLASPIMFLMRLEDTRTITCFLDGPLVVCWTFLALLLG